jgi:hypothetical protein
MVIHLRTFKWVYLTRFFGPFWSGLVAGVKIFLEIFSPFVAFG